MTGSTYSIDSSLGHMDVEFGWSDWVSVTTPRSLGASYAAKRLVPTEEDLAHLFSSFGLPDQEADSLARELWRRRPHEAGAVEGDGLAPVSGQPLILAACLITLVLVIAAALLSF